MLPILNAYIRKASRTEVEKEYRRKVSCVPWDLLRRSFMELSVSPEAFLTLRSHFIRTWSSCSMGQYVLGVGDRHLSNYMVDMESGGVIGIDFGHAFGTATQVQLKKYLLSSYLKHSKQECVQCRH